jgi:ABC-type transport system involved in cytochrome bd biosynthesis fused ATPase/permease subunit
LYLKRLAEGGTRKPGVAIVGIGPILRVTAPFYVAIILVTAIFKMFGWTGALGFTLEILISVSLLVALFYSGFRFVYYRAQSRKNK